MAKGTWDWGHYCVAPLPRIPEVSATSCVNARALYLFQRMRQPPINFKLSVGGADNPRNGTNFKVFSGENGVQSASEHTYCMRPPVAGGTTGPSRQQMYVRPIYDPTQG